MLQVQMNLALCTTSCKVSTLATRQQANRNSMQAVDAADQAMKPSVHSSKSTLVAWCSHVVPNDSKQHTDA
jgi:hypothetical protein